MRGKRKYRPLVTFAVIAYNQEEFVREAVEGAFAQTYEPLEIILSDDCSSDCTSEVMECLSSSYTGPHKVILRKGDKNLGIAEHINSIAKLANGEVIVMAAGDDISDKSRTERIIKEFASSAEVEAVFSGYETVPAQCKRKKPSLSPEFSTAEILSLGGGVDKGATYAYSRDCFFWPAPLPGWIISEDRILPLRASLLGKIRYIDAPLVKYRVPIDEKSKKDKRDRPLWLHVEDHFHMMFSHLCAWRSENQNRVISYYYFRAIVVWLEFAVRTNRRSGSRSATGILFLPLRLLRKATSIIRSVRHNAIIAAVINKIRPRVSAARRES